MVKQRIFYTKGCGVDEFPAELGDHVEFNWAWTGPLTYCGHVTAIHPRKRSLRIRYRDEDDWTVKTAEPKVKVAIVPIEHVDFIARDM